VKTSLAPGSQVVTDYLDQSNLTADLDAMGFQTVGYGCTTCIGNSGPLEDPIVDAIENNKLVVSAVLSGNRNFEGRVHANVRANYLASPPLVVAYALAGSTKIDLTTQPLGTGSDGQPVYLKDIWPTQKEVNDTVHAVVTRKMFLERYSDVFKGPTQWQAIKVEADSDTYRWNSGSTYVQNPPYFEGMTMDPAPIASIQGRAFWQSWPIASRPTISPPPAISGRSPRLVTICWSIRSARPTSTPMAPGAATIR